MLFFRKNFKHLIYVIFLPLIFFIYFLKPLKYIIFCEIGSGRIGSFVNTVGIALYAKNNISEIKKKKILFFFAKNISNQQIKIMAKRFLNVSSNRIILKLLSEAIIFWGQKKNHIINSDYFGLRNMAKISPQWFEHKKTYLHFNFAENKKGLELLTKLGVEPGKEWICIHNRDSSYLNKVLPNQGAPALGGDHSYHSYRNFSVNSLIPAAEFFTSKGYYVLRMGSVVEEKLETKNPKIIDYANSELQSDFSDIYLLGNCKAYFGANSGIECIPEMFRKPKYNVNFSSTDIHYATIFNPWLFIFKRIKSLDTNRFLSMKEILKSDFAYSNTTQIFEKHNVKPIENTSIDIKAFAMEIAKEFEGELIENEEDMKIKKEFWNIYYNYVDKEKVGNIQPKISPSFLRNNLDLLN